MLLQLSFVLDYSDGEIARYQALRQDAATNAGGAYLDWIGHYYVPATMIAALAYGAFSVNGHEWLLLAALVIVFSLVRIAYSARDHVLLGLYRDRPELRSSPEMVRAVLARQGGDPELLDLEAGYRERRAGSRRARPALEPPHQPRPAAGLSRPGQPGRGRGADRPAAERARRRLPGGGPERRADRAGGPTGRRACRPSAPSGPAGL